MATSTVASDGAELGSDYWMARRDALFRASCIALIVTAMSFAIRGSLIQPLGDQFGLSKEQIGLVNSTAFWGFTLAMMFGGPLCDVLGLGRLIKLAAVGHFVGIVMTILARDFWSLYFSTLIFGIANGMVEAACNPLVATLYPDQKIKRLNLFHVWFPGGIVIGGLAAHAIKTLNIGGEAHYWQVQMASMLLPLVIYIFLFRGQKFPPTERVASGISTGTMFVQCLRPGFLLLVVCMLLSAATELGTGQWISDIMTHTTGVQGILYLVWINGLMAVGRTFAGPLVHRLSPVAILVASSFFSFIGLLGLSRVTSPALAFPAATIFAVGICFFWPTMLGIVSERFPKTGALGLAIIGGAGMLSVAFILPIMGGWYDTAIRATLPQNMTLDTAPASIKHEVLAAGGATALGKVAVLPLILLVIFAAIVVWDRARGGYKKESLQESH